jgi:hypothetical protein
MYSSSRKYGWRSDKRGRTAKRRARKKTAASKQRRFHDQPNERLADVTEKYCLFCDAHPAEQTKHRIDFRLDLSKINAERKPQSRMCA